MTVMAAEGAAGAVERGSITKAGARQPGRHRKSVSRVEQGRLRRQQEADRAAASARTRQRAIDYGQRGAGYAGEVSLPSGGGYQGAILAEFLIAVLVVAFMPLAAGPPADGKAGPSPYRVNDIEQLAAIGVVYFLLAMFSGGRHGKAAAWFGGLILLGIGFKKMAGGQFSAAVSGLQGKPAPTEAGSYPGGGSGGGGGGHDVTQSAETPDGTS